MVAFCMYIVYPLTAGWEQTIATGARYGGVSKSEYRVSSDVWRLEKVKCKIVAAGRLTGIDPAILAAIASRGSEAGYQLNSRGYNYHSATKYGYMQLSTTRNHVVTSGGPSGQPHFDQAAKVLRSALEYVEDHRSYWQKAMQVKAGIAAYDVGVHNYIIPSTSSIDMQTSNKDYSNDVLARAKYLRRKGIF